MLIGFRCLQSLLPHFSAMSAIDLSMITVETDKSTPNPARLPVHAPLEAIPGGVESRTATA